MAARRSTLVISVHGGVVQDVFSSDPDIRVILVDWDQEGTPLSLPGIVEVESHNRRQRAAVVEHQAAPLSNLRGTDVERALLTAQIDGHLDEPRTRPLDLLRGGVRLLSTMPKGRARIPSQRFELVAWIEMHPILARIHRGTKNGHISVI